MVPDFQTLMLPVLELAHEGELSMDELEEGIVTRFSISEDDRHALLPSGKQTRLKNRIGWARTYLKQAGLLTFPQRGFARITDAGRAVVAAKPQKIDKRFLQQFPEYNQFRLRTKQDDASATRGTSSDSEATPEELLKLSVSEIDTALAEELVERVQSAPPAFFEAAIVQLLMKMGYGHGADAGRVLGQSSDNGVDGVINMDRLGVDQVYIQAKRYSSENTVGGGEIRDFFGALSLKDVQKGIFVTTSRFTQGALHTAEKLGARIILIDGAQLGKLMLTHEVGCRVREVYKLREIEEDFFT
ncbi:restriction endonuclease [Marivita sp. S0852]|uniref:restriction endonuclease n=1 Tax=Marivita sp. S0852 TaxID=3373893 RepID=UPI003982C427